MLLLLVAVPALQTVLLPKLPVVVVPVVIVLQ
jgi:hypothetical protein